MLSCFAVIQTSFEFVCAFDAQQQDPVLTNKMLFFLLVKLFTSVALYPLLLIFLGRMQVLKTQTPRAPVFLDKR